MPRAATPSQAPAQAGTHHLQALISSTTYPKPFSFEQLEFLRHEIHIRRSGSHARLVELDPSEEERMKREKKERKRREKDRAAEAEAAALAERRAAESGVKVKRERTSLSPAASVASTSAMPVMHASQYKKKKKRVVDSDDEGQARDRSMTVASPPGPSHHMTTSGLKVKLPGNTKGRPSLPSVEIPYTPPIIAGPSGYGNHIDFSLPTPSNRPLIPPRPGVQKPLPPGPKKQADVNEDFSNVKAPTQVNFPTFWAGVEPYVREIREDDLAMLGFKAEAPELYDVPPRGRHYTEVWDEEDGNPIGTTHRISVPNLRQLNGTYPPSTLVPSWIPAQDLKEEYSVEELRGLGNITERVVAAVVALETDPASHGRMATDFDGKEAVKVDVKELEERVKKELRAVMLLGEHEEFEAGKRDDDEITASLRTCQRLLLAQTAINDARKLRLAEKAKHRLAYAEYQNALDGVESNIEEHWAKRTKKHGHASKKPAPVPTKDSRPPVPEVLKKLVQVRKKWVESVGDKMKGMPRGVMVGLPEESAYLGIAEAMDEDEARVEGVVDDGHDDE
ncbi:histone acetyltransferases subunit 3-domain-containing protein [Dioszegia hungarica]|uniref:Histone acetyltransferases subunit 3-domain-containing protein n=1 Tax=Dioszegia hungarica TaxID=4972 RepID=A0AA38HB69_9TREE|nr:histone acetyltransferases subunit 3-domain-containing protein [Dioszegia hungarica]KAI9636349.1 histone acetyltransferases subunit 3-domain-containing protein [Dioszegia hungarica]